MTKRIGWFNLIVELVLVFSEAVLVIVIGFLGLKYGEPASKLLDLGIL